MLLLAPNTKTIVPQEFVKPIATIGLFFFTFCIYAIAKKFNGSSIGFQIDKEGFTDFVNASYTNKIVWQDVTAIKTETLFSNTFVLVFVKNPQHYIQQSTGLKKSLLKGNFNSYGTPISVSSTALKTTTKDLYEALLKHW
jgi:hypothetical protein